MKTEEEVIYTIWDIVRAGTISNDDAINERLMRSFLSIHRGKHLDRTFKRGEQLPDEVFQSLGEILFAPTTGNDFISALPMPKTIRMRNYAFIIDKSGYSIPMVNSEEFDTSKKSTYGKYHPKVKFIDNKLYLYTGKRQVVSESGTLSVMNSIIDELSTEQSLNTLTLNVRAVLVNPDDSPGYDFTQDAYPYPDELIEDLINSVNAREFNFFLRTKSDETTDGRDNTAEHGTREEF